MGMAPSSVILQKNCPLKMIHYIDGFAKYSHHNNNLPSLHNFQFSIIYSVQGMGYPTMVKL